MDGKWSDWIALWGLTDMLNIAVALVSSLGEAGLEISNPTAHKEATSESSGSVAVQFGDHFRSEDHFRSGIICGPVQLNLIQLPETAARKAVFV